MSSAVWIALSVIFFHKWIALGLLSFLVCLIAAPTIDRFSHRIVRDLNDIHGGDHEHEASEVGTTKSDNEH